MKKRIFSVLLTIILTLTSINYPEVTLNAEEYDVGTGAGRQAAITMYGKADNSVSAVNLAVSSAVKFDYGTHITLSLGEVSYPAKFYIKRKGSDGEYGDDSLFKADNVYEPGEYRLGFICDTESEDQLENMNFTDYGFTVTATKLAVVSGLTWNGTKAVWNTLKTDKNGNTLSGSCNYTVELYRDNNKIAEKNVTAAGSDTQSVDFKNDIYSNNGGEGKYTFAVKAVVPASLSSYYTDSDLSSQSIDKLVAVKVTLNTSTGIASAVNSGVAEGDAAKPFVLVAGADGCNSANIKAVPSDGWSFGSWTVQAGTQNVSGITFTNASSAATVVSLGADYNGGTSITITANPKESTAPSINSFDKGTGDNEGKLVAAAKDEQSGLKAYAFSSEVNAEDILDNEWTVLDTAVSEEKTVTYTPVSSGNYYFYAKDSDGNVAKSGSAIPVSVITYENYYENNAKYYNKTALYIGTGTYNLPDLSDSQEQGSSVHRSAYVFDGWYNSSGEDATKVTEIDSNSGTDITCYARWNLTDLSWQTPLTAPEGGYNYTGKNITLSASVNATTAEVEYTWYKKNGDSYQELETNTTGNFNIRNVSDYGTYKVNAAIEYIDDNGVAQQKDLSGADVEIVINKADLTVKAEDKSITYKEDAPQYTYKYTGLVGDDITDVSKAEITEGTVSCDYVKGNPCKSGGYDIVVYGFTSDNYNINMESGKLTVQPVDVTKESSGVTVTLNTSTEYPYTGSPVTPEITVKDEETTLTSGTDYDVTYDDNVKAGIHTATVTFKGNYKGYVTREFTITKNSNYELRVKLDNWTYGVTANDPSVTTEIPFTSPQITYYYVDGEVTDLSTVTGSETKPENAGTYTVYAVVKDPGGNYSDKKSEPYTFTIDKKVVKLVAGSKEWEYDGNPHSYDSYTITDKDGNVIDENSVFVKNTESFQSIKVTGSITDVTLNSVGENIGVSNTVSYTLTSVTNGDNYDIQCVDGVLKVTPTRLLYPANLSWDGTNPGTATWVAISKSNLIVKYEVSLYMHDEAALGEQTDTLVATKTVSDIQVSFTDEIHNNISDDSRKSFYFTVKTLVSDSDDDKNKAKNDYTDSDVSGKSDSLCSVTVKLSKKLCVHSSEEQAGLKSVSFTGAYAGRDAVTLIAGESFSVKAELETGYIFDPIAYCPGAGETHYLYNIWHPVNPDYKEYFTYDYKGSGLADITVSPQLSQSLSDVLFTASTEDDSPYYRNYTAVNNEDYSGVTISLEAMDTLGVKRWRMEEVREETVTYSDGSTYTRYVPIRYFNETEFKDENGKNPGGGVYSEASYNIKEPGTYRIQISDSLTDDNRWTSASEVFTVYEIKFEKGDTDDEAHTMSPVYKLANTEITLPECAYVKTGYSFQNWKGNTTGISVDKAVFKANASDTLTACWTNNQYTYNVDYYYMKTDGTYGDTPDETAVFNGKYGDVIVASSSGGDVATEAIQKPKSNYSNDDAPVGVSDYNNKVTLTQDNQTVRIYYKSGAYTITYSYTEPGREAATSIIRTYNYGASIVEPEKPSITGYDFVGWVYEGSGMAPETMPAQNLTATGRFVAKSANYKIVYHMETLGSGSTHTNEYEINDSLTQTLNSKQGEKIKAYVNKEGELSDNEIEGISVDGFSLRGVVVTYGSAANSGEEQTDNLPEDAVTGSNVYAEGTVEYASAQTLYINYYYTRNEYQLTLEVWKDSREDAGNKQYSKSQTFQYGEEIAALVASYKQDSYYIDENGVSKLDDFTMPSGYKFASYTDFSTGNAPSVMPAGNVTVTRDIVAADKVSYYINVYFEKSEIGQYDRMTRLTYEAVAGTKIKIVGSTDSKDDTSYQYIDYNDFLKTINNYNYYKHVTVEGSKEEGEVVADTENPLELSIYFERITTTAKINYYYGNSKTGGNNCFATIELEGKWGSEYTFDPTALFYDKSSTDTSTNWITNNNTYNSQSNIIKNSSIVTTITDTNGNSQDSLAYDFCINSYLVSYQCYYRYFNDNDIISWVWPSHTFTTVGEGSNYKTGYGKENREPTAAGIGDTITCYFGTENNAYSNVYYNQIVEDDDFYLDVRLDYQSNFNDKTLGWYTGTAENGNSTETKVYPDSTKSYIPITYKYNDTYYQLRIMNKCAIVNGTLTSSTGGIEAYPAANAKNRTYTYSDTNTLKAGFTHIEGDYYFYNPDGVTEEVKTALGTEPCVFLADEKDRFIQGAYTGISQGNGTKAYEQAKAFLDAYIAAHTGDSILSEPDDSATALAFNNTSFGSTYIYGEHNYLTYHFYYHDKCRLTYYYNGNTCTNHEYVYGTRVSKDDVKCTDIATEPAGYHLVWYTDSSYTNPIPEEGLLMNVDRTVYGRMEKTTIPNMEYIYYELADVINVDSDVYNYVTEDNIATIRIAGNDIQESRKSIDIQVDNGYGVNVTKQCAITTYTYDGAVVMVSIERPTVSYTELYLAKDTEAYTDYSGDYENAYGMTGFYYDETNTDNRSYGYVNTSVIKLKVYFARDKYQVKVITNVSEDSNPEYHTMSIDQKVQFEEPVKNGYTFTGWTWQKVVDERYEEYTPIMEENQNYFKMPAFNLVAAANWEPAEFNQTVTHYFQTSDQVYDSGFIDRITGTPVNYSGVTFGAVTGNASVYKAGESITAVVLAASNGDTYYFNGGKIQDDALTVREADLVAAVTSITVKSEDNTVADSGTVTGLVMYSYAYTLYQPGTTVSKLTAGDTYSASYGMKLEYYYTRSARSTVRLYGVATDGEDSGLKFNGAGNHVFGENVNLIAVMSDGYSFLGWFKAGDILNNYPDTSDTEDNRKPLSGYDVKDNIENIVTGESAVTPVCVTQTYNLSVVEDIDLIAVVKPDSVVAPDLVINGKKEYTYGYQASASNSLMAIASKGEGADKTTITGYQWYSIEAELNSENEAVAKEGAHPQIMEGQTSSTLLIPTGLNAGAYIYRCEVSYKNNDNGRTDSVHKDQGIVVNKAKMTVTTSNYTGVFDNSPHKITLRVDKPGQSGDYEVYYSSDNELNESNYSDHTTTTLPEYIHVNNNGSEACAHTTYFYVKDKTGNYNDYSGSATVNITPKTVTIKALNATFSKMYDGNVDVIGSVTDVDSDMYNFAYNGKDVYYMLGGFVEGDTAANTYILGCEAKFNDYHVTTAKSFTISKLKLVNNSSGATEYDYAFPSATSLTFAGMITPRQLNVSWENKEDFEYNGDYQAPAVSLSESQDNPIPEADKDYIELTVTGKQINAGSYTAYASAGLKAGGRFLSSDYTFDTLSKDYNITKRNITIVPVTAEYDYNGNTHTINTYKIMHNGLEDTIASSSSYTTIAKPVKSYVNAGTYDDLKFKDFVLSDSSTGRILTDNYNVEYETGTMTIKPAYVRISGITADEKSYDGKTDAVIHLDNIVFSPLYSQGAVQDVLSVDPEKISGAYDSEQAGTTTVNITIGSDALTGESKGNYVLDVENSQKTAVGRINQSVIKLKASRTETTYGEEAPFAYTYSGIVKPDGTARVWSDITVTGTPVYKIKPITDSVEEETGWVTYSKGVTSAGSYRIQIDVSGMSTQDYTFQWEDDDNSVLVVNKRPVSLVGNTGAETEAISKTYDGTTDVGTVPVKGTHYSFGKVTDGGGEVAASGVLDADAASLDLSGKTYQYNTKDVSAQYVVLSEAVINNNNYELKNTECNIKGQINPKDLTITAVSKSITYGTTDPGYSVTYDGLVTVGDVTEDAGEVLSGSVSYDGSGYEPIDTSANRHVGTYTIVPGGLGGENSVNGNYKIHYVNGTLTVNSKEVNLTADDKELRYKTGNTEGDIVDGKYLPIYTYSGPEWAYSSDVSRYSFSGVTMPRTVTGKTGSTEDTLITVLTVPGEYPIKITTKEDGTDGTVVSGISKTNGSDTYKDYIFRAVDGTLTVKKFELVISGTLSIADKYYDGTTKVVQEPTEASIKGLLYDGVDNADKPYVGIDTGKLLSGSHYASKDAGENVSITLNIVLNDYLSARYTLKSATGVTASSKILPRPLKVKADDLTITYGDPVPDNYGISVVPVEVDSVNNMGLVTVEGVGEVEGYTESLTAEYGFSGPTGYTCSYSATQGSFSPVGNYNVTPVGVSAGNYDVTCVNTGILTVTQATLATPSPQWSSDSPGTVTWNAVSGIGDVKVSKYKVTLFKDGAELSGTTVELPATEGTASYSKNFADVLRINGGGQYTVKVTAIASTDNNADKKNVKDSDAGTTATPLYATRITPEFAGEAAGKADQIDSKDPIYVNNAESYVVIAGESNIPVKAKLKNSTGYTVRESADTGLTLGSAGSIDNGTSCYNTTVSVGKTSTPAAETKVIITLTARPATLGTYTINTDKTEVTYGFLDVAAPLITAGAAPEETDNIGAEGYTYSYKWEFKPSAIDDYQEVSSGNVSSYSFPHNYSAEYTPFGQNYRVRCIITATRNDNGQTVSKTAKDVANSNNSYIRVKVNRGSYNPTISFNPGEDSWYYGDVRKIPVVGGLVGEATTDKIHYQYSNDNGVTWTDTMFTDVGTYYVRAHIDETTNYDAVDTDNVSYTVMKTKLGTPSNAQMSSSATAPYGRITWDAVNGPKENAGTAGYSDSDISVKYELTLSYIPVGGNTKVQIGQPVVTTGTEYDFTDRITEAGTYYVTIKAVVDEKRDGQDVSNCDDGDAATIEAFITIGATVTSNQTGNSYTKVYDGQPLTLTVDYSDANTHSYKWFKDGTEIPGATSDSISITYVEESASFVCEITSGGNKIYSSAVKASVTPRPITVTTATDGKTYDGNPLSKQEYSITSTLGLVNGDAITGKEMVSSQTFAGSTDNTITDIVITRTVNSETKVVYSDTDTLVKDNYTIEVVEGTLTVNQRSITVKATDAEKTYNGAPLTSNGYTISSGSLVSGESIDEALLSFDGSITDAGSTPNTPSNCVIKNGSEDRTGNYNIHYENGTLTVNPKPLKITAGDGSKIYDGTALTVDSFSTPASLSSDTDYALVSGDRIDSVTISGSQTNAGSSASSPSNAVIKRGDGDNAVIITSNYDIEYIDGTLRVDSRSITVTADDKSSCYGENPALLTCSIVSPSNAGAMTDERIIQELGITLSASVNSAPVSSTTPVGEYNDAITVSYTSNGNYSVTTVKGKYTVTPATIQIRAEDKTVDYDTAQHSITFETVRPASDGVTKYYSTSNLSDSDWHTEIGKLQAGNTSDKITVDNPVYTKAGTYTVYCYGVKDNYTAGKASATLTINKRSISSQVITVDSLPDVTYKGSEYTPAVTVKYGQTQLTPSSGTGESEAAGDYTVSYSNNLHKGTATVTITGQGNYSGSRVITFEIKPRPVSLTWTDPAGLTYDGQEKTVTASITNICGTDQVSVSTYTGNKNTAAGSYTAAVTAISGDNASDYTLENGSNISHGYTISKRNLEIETLGKDKVYDGTPLTNYNYKLLNSTSAASGETIEITYSGSQTDAGGSENTVSSVKVKKNGTSDPVVYTTDNYNINVTEGTLTVNPKPLTAGDITINQSVWEYTGNDIEPEYTVSKVLIADSSAVSLTEGRDYTITTDSVKKASSVGTYVIKAQGCGNFSGDCQVTYEIKDTTEAYISGIMDGGRYCIKADIVVTDPNLKEVVVKKGSDIVASFNSFENGTLSYTISGSNADEAGSQYSVYVRDLVSKDINGVEQYNAKTWNITIYKDHKFDSNSGSYTWDESKLTGSQTCNNTADVVDTIINRWGTVEWNYAYSYSTPSGIQSGVQGVEARATYARVELVRDGTVIATQYVNCNDQCGPGGTGSDSGSATYKFTTYNPSDSGAGSGTANIPLKDSNGRDYTYSVNIKAGKMNGETFVPVNDYSYTDSLDYSAPYTSSGYKRTFSYSPECFEVPWKVTLNNLPFDDKGDRIIPSKLYVKVMFALGPDADDSETETGYRIITQQSGGTDIGVGCEAVPEQNSVTYSGSYPVWKYIGGTTDSYYHRIQVVGYELDNQYVDISGEGLKSVNDSDHVNHTIYYDSSSDGASGTIRFELSGLLPSLVFDRNDGSTEAHAILNCASGDTVTYDRIQAVQNPVRDGYRFLGWYGKAVDGDEIDGDINIGAVGIVIYAHWEVIPVTPDNPGSGNNPGGGSGDTPSGGSGTSEDEPGGGSGSSEEASDDDYDDDDYDNSSESGGSRPGNSDNSGNGQSPADNRNPDNNTPDSSQNNNTPVSDNQNRNPDWDNQNTGQGNTDSSDSNNNSEEEFDRNSRLLVYTEYAGEDGTKESSASGNSSSSDENGGNNGGSTNSDSGASESRHLTAALPDTMSVAEIVLTEEEWQILAGDGDIKIRLTIDDTRQQDEVSELEHQLENLKDQMLEMLTNQYNSGNYDDGQSGNSLDLSGFKTVHFKSYVDLTLEKKINDADWQRLLSTNEPVRVVINIPDGLFANGQVPFLIKKDNSKFILFEDMDNDPNTITIMTADFNSQYMLVFMVGEDESLISQHTCRWHYIIYIISLLYFIILLLTLKRKKDAYSKDNKEQNAFIIRSISQLVLLTVYIIANYYGTCHIELPASIIGMIVITTEQILTFRHKYKNDSENSEESADR